jgi:hypothetical protein
MLSTIREPTARNSLCQFCIDWNQKSAVPANSKTETGAASVFSACSSLYWAVPAKKVSNKRQHKETEQSDRQAVAVDDLPPSWPSRRWRRFGGRPIWVVGGPILPVEWFGLRRATLHQVGRQQNVRAHLEELGFPVLK